jgi:hypothetical protein
MIKYNLIICNFGVRRVFRLFLRQSLLGFFPESYIMRNIKMAGLLTYSLIGAFPSLSVFETVARVP